MFILHAVHPSPLPTPNKPGQCMIESRLFIRGSVLLYRATSWVSFCYALPCLLVVYRQGLIPAPSPPPPSSSLPSTLWNQCHIKNSLVDWRIMTTFDSFLSRGFFPERGKHVRVRDSVAAGLQTSLEVLCGTSCLLPVSGPLFLVNIASCHSDSML